MTPTDPVAAISSRIQTIRGVRVMLDADLAELYGVKTERMNQQVRRNIDRFPDDFVFQLSEAEWRSAMSLQIASSLQRTRRVDLRPLAFTEHGCLMLANVLRSPRAAEVSVLVVRAFVRLRGAIAGSQELARRVDELTIAVGKHGVRLDTHQRAILQLLADIRRLTTFPESHARSIGFTADIDAKALKPNRKPGKKSAH
jgi:hypothetical protein